MGKTKMKTDDVGATVGTLKPAVSKTIKKAKRVYKASKLKSAREVNEDNREKFFDTIPQGAIDDPVAYARDHARAQIPRSVKELEWQLKFGDARTRKEIALEFLAFEGLSNKGPNTGQVVPAIQLVFSGALPWSHEAPKLPSTTIDGTIIERDTDAYKESK